MTRLDDKVAVVTGAGSGIGRASAIALAENGARLAITDLDPEQLSVTAAAVRGGRGARWSRWPATSSIRRRSTSWPQRRIRPIGRIDVLDNNVGIVVAKPLREHTLEDFDRLMHINCWSYVLTTQRIAPEMHKAGGGSIINISSIGGLVALPNVARVLRVEVGGHRADAVDRLRAGARTSAATSSVPAGCRPRCRPPTSPACPTARRRCG